MLTGKFDEAPSPRFERDLRSRGVSDALIDLIGDCVDGEPTARPKDAGELGERLGKLNRAPPPRAPSQKGGGRSRSRLRERCALPAKLQAARAPIPPVRSKAGRGP